MRDLHTGEIVDQLAEQLADRGVAPNQVQLEITEGALMADPRRVLATLHRLDKLGVALSLDDFGTGYSSLQHLRRLPLAEVKIDRSFVLGMADGPGRRGDRRLDHRPGPARSGCGWWPRASRTTRPGGCCSTAGCDVAQGWFYARPMPADELAAWLARYRPLSPVPSPDAEIPPARR